MMGINASKVGLGVEGRDLIRGQAVRAYFIIYRVYR